jgi:predicted double-glycine peptidase
MARMLIGVGVLLVAAAVTGPPAGADQRKRPKVVGTFEDVPLGAIKVPLRDVPQVKDYSCGAACTMAVCCYYDVGPRNQSDYIQQLGTTKEGTYYGDIRKFLKKNGLRADVQAGMTPKDLRALLDRGIPVICSIQAWGDDPKAYASVGNGHYVVAVGYDGCGRFYFMDPWANHERATANPRYGYLSEADLEARWHELESTWELYMGLGIAVYPEKNGKPAPRLKARRIE